MRGSTLLYTNTIIGFVSMETIEKVYLRRSHRGLSSTVGVGKKVASLVANCLLTGMSIITMEACT